MHITSSFSFSNWKLFTNDNQVFYFPDQDTEECPKSCFSQPQRHYFSSLESENMYLCHSEELYLVFYLPPSQQSLLLLIHN